MRIDAGFEDPHATRISIAEVNGETQVIVPPLRNIGAALFMLAWLGGWTLGGLFALRSFYEGTGDMGSNAFLAFWLCGWAFGELAVIYSLLWMFFGADWVTASRTGLRISKVLGIRWRSKIYAAASISNLRWEDQVAARKSRISFEYGPKTVSFAGECDAGEGRYVVAALSRQLGLKTTAGSDEGHSAGKWPRP